MAIYRLEAKIVGRSRGHSVTAAAAYRARARIVDGRTGVVHDFTRRGGVEHTEILTPAHAPAWMREDRARLWNLVEASETRTNAQLARELVLTLPRELSAEQRIAVTRAFVSSELVSLGMIADVAHHTGRIDADGLAQNHAHVLLSLREVTQHGFSRHKMRAWNSTELLERWRAEWAAHLNEALKQADIACAPVDHRSLAKQRVELQERSSAARVVGDEVQAFEFDLAAYELNRTPEPKRGRALHLEERSVPSEQAELVEAVRSERKRRRTQVETFRVWLRERTREALQATHSLGDRLRAGLTAAVLAPLQAANLSASLNGLGRGEDERLPPEERTRPHRRELRLRQVRERRLKRLIEEIEIEVVRDRGRGR